MRTGSLSRSRLVSYPGRSRLPERQPAGLLGFFDECTQFDFVGLRHANEPNTVAEVGVACDYLSPRLNLFVIEPQDDIHASGRFECLHHFNVGAAFTDIGGLATPREILHHVARFDRQGHFHARKFPPDSSPLP